MAFLAFFGPSRTRSDTEFPQSKPTFMSYLTYAILAWGGMQIFGLVRPLNRSYLRVMQ